MAEEAAEPVKKGGNKLMIVAVAVMMLVVGGFFGLKMKGGKGHAEPDLHLGDIIPVKEFLVNLKGTTDRDQKVQYLRTELALQIAKSAKKEEISGDQMSAVQSAINDVLRECSLKDIDNVRGTDALKIKIAAAVNRALEIATGKTSKDIKITASKPIKHPDWDSDTGPVLKVYFVSFAFQ